MHLLLLLVMMMRWWWLTAERITKAQVEIRGQDEVRISETSVWLLLYR